MPFGILEKRAAGPAGGLLGSPQFPKLGDVHRFVRVAFFSEAEVEFRGNDEPFGGIFQNARPVGETHVGTGERFDFSFRNVPYVRRNEHVGGFESEASGIPYYGSTEASRQADPRDEP